MFNIRNKKTGLLMMEIGPLQDGQKLELRWTSSRGEACLIRGFDSEKDIEAWKAFQQKMGVELELVAA